MRTGETDARQTFWARAFAPTAIAPLVYFRLAFGLILLWEIWRYYEHGWIARYYIQPTYFFGYAGFEWLKPLPGFWMYMFFGGLALLALGILAGLFYRLSAALFFLGFTYWFLLDQTRYLNHFYLISLISFLLIFVPAHRALSLDVLRRPTLQASRVPAWTVGLLRFQVGIAYFFGGIAKLNPDWLQGVPMLYWLADRTDFPLIGSWFTERWASLAFSYGGLLFDLLIVPALLWRRTRTPALLVMLLFHLTNARLFSIGIFPWFMIAATVILFAPEWITRTALWRVTGDPGPGTAAPPGPLQPRQRRTLLLLGVYVTWQVLMPLRHWLYPGNVSWTEEGHNFSWHMKLRGKTGDLQMYIFDSERLVTEAVDLSQYLTPAQIDQMATRPHMIQQFAHDLADQLRAQGRADFSIHARAWVSLNGRDWQLLIDPQVDLASQPRDIWHKSWVLPLETPLFPDDTIPSEAGSDSDD